MRCTFGNYRGQYPIPAATIEEAQVTGTGGAYAPVLRVPIKLDCSFGGFLDKEAVRFNWIKAVLSLPTGEQIVARDVVIDIMIVPQYAPKDHPISLEFPLDTGLVALLERTRNGLDLKMNLEMRLEASQLHEIEEIQKTPWKAYAYGFVQNWRLQTNTELTIPQSAWIKHVLPGLGQGRIHLIELPAVPIEETEAIGKAFTALKQAQFHHRMGNYDDAVGKCRIAMESFWEYVDGTERDSEGRLKRIPKLKSSWEIKLGKTTYEWLNASLTAMKQAANPTAHNPDPHYDQFQSQMIQAIVTTLISYAARRQQASD